MPTQAQTVCQKPFWTKLLEQKILLHQMITMNTSPKNSQIRWKKPKFPHAFFRTSQKLVVHPIKISGLGLHGVPQITAHQHWKVGKLEKFHHLLTRYLNDFGCPWSKSDSTIFSFQALWSSFFGELRKWEKRLERWVKKQKCLFWSPENKDEISHPLVV